MSSLNMALGDKMGLDAFFAEQDDARRIDPPVRRRTQPAQLPFKSHVKYVQVRGAQGARSPVYYYLRVKLHQKARPDDRVTRVLVAMRQSETAYRTVQSVASQTGLPPTEVEKAILRLPNVRRALFRHYDGSSVYTTRNITVRELFASAAQLVLNSYK